MTVVMYQVTGLTCSFVYGMGLQPTGIKAGNVHHFIFFHVRPADQQPTIMGHKNVGRPWVTETCVIRYQPFLSVHNDRFHSECYTNDKGNNKTCENKIILILV